MSLFGKKEKDAAAEIEMPIHTAPVIQPSLEKRPPATEAPVIPLAQAQPAGRTAIDASIRVKGEILGDEDVTVDGQVSGIINLSRTLVVGKRGIVDADVRASSVVVHGSVSGNIVADQRVEILATGRLEGNIKAPKIMIAEGAHFKGNIDMTSGSQGATLGVVKPSAVPEKTGKSIPFERQA